VAAPYPGTALYGRPWSRAGSCATRWLRGRHAAEPARVSRSSAHRDLRGRSQVLPAVLLPPRQAPVVGGRHDPRPGSHERRLREGREFLEFLCRPGQQGPDKTSTAPDACFPIGRPLPLAWLGRHLRPTGARPALRRHGLAGRRASCWRGRPPCRCETAMLRHPDSRTGGRLLSTSTSPAPRTGIPGTRGLREAAASMTSRSQIMSPANDRACRGGSKTAR